MSERLVNLLHPGLTPATNSPAYQAVSELGTRQLSVSQGISQTFIHQLIEKSRQEHIFANTPKDPMRRFRCFDAFLAWHRPEREVFLLHKQQDLGGIIWFTPDNDGAVPRFAIRIYEGYSGDGLAKPFMRIAHARIANTAMAAAGLQLAVDNNNVRALQLCESFGYEPVASGMERTDMVLSCERLAEIVTPSHRS